MFEPVPCSQGNKANPSLSEGSQPLGSWGAGLSVLKQGMPSTQGPAVTLAVAAQTHCLSRALGRAQPGARGRCWPLLSPGG